MEKTDSSVVLPMDVVWSNIGLWLYLWDINKIDYNGKITQGDVMLHSVNNF